MYIRSISKKIKMKLSNVSTKDQEDASTNLNLQNHNIPFFNMTNTEQSMIQMIRYVYFGRLVLLFW